MKKMISIILIIVTIMVCSITATSGAYIPSEIKSPWENEKTELQLQIANCEQKQTAAHDMAEAARMLGYNENHAVIILAKTEWHAAESQRQEAIKQFNDIITKEAKMFQQFEEYPIATIIWYYLKDLGYNDYVCAGIVGNIMAEVGGHTLDIRYWLGSSSYYGMCQWSLKYNKNINNTTLDQQLEYLKNTIETEINNFGFCYKKNFNYKSFLALTNEKDAALAFAKTYERCASAYYNIRKTNATKALEYFTK